MARDDDPASGSKPASAPGDAAALEASMRDFAEGATALAAASIRMQMMLLEQTREMLDDMSELVKAATDPHDGSEG